MATKVIWDAEQQIAAIVNEEAGRALGPILQGPGADRVLTLFVESTPWDVAVMEPAQLRQAVDSFIAIVNEDDESPLGEDSGLVQAFQEGELVPDAVVTESVAVDLAGDAPPPQPADTDQPLLTPPTVRSIECVNCMGTGKVASVTDGSEAQCGMCRGTGRLLEQVT